MTILLHDKFESTKIMNLKLPVKGIVGIVQRRNRIIIPNGVTQIMSGDEIIIFTTSTNALVIRKFFEGMQK
jgi:Trk K+ transport system NAD-binding subunit